jgi:hypothetical protein
MHTDEDEWELAEDILPSGDVDDNYFDDVKKFETGLEFDDYNKIAKIDGFPPFMAS